MPKTLVQGHCPAFMKQATTAAQRPAEARGRSLETAQKIDLGFIKLKIHRPNSGLEPVLRELAKAQVERIEKKVDAKPSSNGVKGVWLNCKVEVNPSAQAEHGHHQAVECRHFATAFAQHPGKKAELMTQLSTREGIVAKFDGRLSEVENSYQKIVREAPQGCKHVVSSDHLGSYLTALAATLNQGPGRPEEANCLLLTQDHVMALHVERKCKAGVDYFSAKLYDPNCTATFQRVERPNAEALGPLTLQDMLITKDFFSHYAGEGNASLSMVAVSLNHALQPQMHRSATTHSAQNVHLALLCGVHTELQPMLQAVLNSNLSEKEKAEWLAAKRGDGTPGLVMALKRGNAAAVKVFTEAVLRSNLNENVKAKLLAAKQSNGAPGLLRAFELGHTETLTAFTQAVLNLTLNKELKAELLAAKTSDGTPGLFVALQNGRTEAVKAFTQAVLNSNLNENVKAELLAAMQSNGRPGLFMAFQNGHAETVKAFAQVVLNSSLSEEVKSELLEPVASQTTDY